MWLLAPVLFLAAAVAGHALLCRLPSGMNSVARFLVSGTLAGAALVAYCLLQWGLSAESAAAILAYAAACELYIFLFTLVSGSISVSLLHKLQAGSLSGGEIESELGGKSMVNRRIANMLAVGLLRRGPEGYEKTEQGGFTLWIYRTLRIFFWRTPLIPSVVTRTNPGPISDALGEATMHRVRSRAADIIAVALLFAAAFAIFWPHISGDRLFVGDSDRLNHFLTILSFLVDGYREGALRTWDPLNFGGFDITPFTNPYPTSVLPLLWSAQKLFVAAGTVSSLLFAISGCCAYAFIRKVSGRVFVSFIGAGLYMMSALSVLKVSQNDISFSSFILAPLIMLAIREVRPENFTRCFVALTATLTYLASYAFLQKAAYIFLLAGAYAIYRSYRTKKPDVILVFGLAAIVSLAASFPRIYAMGEDFLGSARHETLGPSDANMRAAPTIHGYEVLRWLDDRIFGRFAAEAASHNGAINLHEGFLLYLSAFAVFAILFWLIRHIVLRPRTFRNQDPDIPFFLLVIAFCFFVVLTKAGNELMYYAFMRIDFIHARIVIIALLPLCALVAIILRHMLEGDGGARSNVPVIAASGLIAVICIVLIETAANRADSRFLALWWPGTGTPIQIAWSAVIRILFSFSAFLLLTGFFVFSKKAPEIRTWVACTLGFLMLGQSFVYARDQISGAHMRSPGMPFAGHVRLLAKPGDFDRPSRETLVSLHTRLDSDHYRTSAVCDPSQIAIFCAPHVAHFWGLRMIDGYLNAVPARIAALPWSSQVLGARTLNFPGFGQLPWPLLGMLNVKYAIGVNRALFTNSVPLPGGGNRELLVDDLQIAENPIAPTPRAFFAKSVKAAANMNECAEFLFPGRRLPASRLQLEDHSCAERFSGNKSFVGDGRISTQFSYQDVDVQLEPSDRERFLILNERYHPRWKAHIDGIESPIYPANVFMRGVVVPPGATRITMHYTPFVYSKTAFAFYAAAIGLFVISLMILRRRRPPTGLAAQPG